MIFFFFSGSPTVRISWGRLFGRLRMGAVYSSLFQVTCTLDKLFPLLRIVGSSLLVALYGPTHWYICNLLQFYWSSPEVLRVSIFCQVKNVSSQSSSLLSLDGFTTTSHCRFLLPWPLLSCGLPYRTCTRNASWIWLALSLLSLPMTSQMFLPLLI